MTENNIFHESHVHFLPYYHSRSIHLHLYPCFLCVYKMCSHKLTTMRFHIFAASATVVQTVEQPARSINFCGLLYSRLYITLAPSPGSHCHVEKHPLKWKKREREKKINKLRTKSFMRTRFAQIKYGWKENVHVYFFSFIRSLFCVEQKTWMTVEVMKVQENSLSPLFVAFM